MWSPWSHGGYGRQCRVHTTTFRTRALRSPAIDRHLRFLRRDEETENFSGKSAQIQANSVSQPPSSNDSRATNRFDSLVFRRNQLIERRAKIRADTGSVKDRLMGLKRLERVGMKTAAWRSIEELIRGANVLFGESV